MWRSVRLLSWFVASIAGMAPAAWAEGVVVSSTAPGINVGRVVGDGETLSLPSDSVTVVLLSTGQTVTLTGPFNGKVEAAAAHAETTQTTQAQGWQSPDLSSLGGSRGQVAPVVPQGGTARVIVEADRSGTWCIEPGGSVLLAAPAQPPAHLRIEDPASGASADMAWSAPGTPQPWPASVPLHDGSRVVATGASGPARELRFVVLDDKAETPPARLIRRVRAGCGRQVDAQLRSMGAQAAPFALYLSTDRGRTPRYTLGEPVNLMIKANRPASVFCFALQDGQVQSVFPGEPGRLDISDQMETRISASRLPVDLTEPPPHLAELRCYAVPSETGKTLHLSWPPPGASTEPSGGRLDKLFAGLPDGQVAEAHVMVSTE